MKNESDACCEILGTLLQLEVRLKAIAQLMLYAGKASELEIGSECKTVNYGIGGILSELADDTNELRQQHDSIFVGQTQLKIP